MYIESTLMSACCTGFFSIMSTPPPTEMVTSPAGDTGKSSRTAVAVGVSVVAIIALLIVAVITAYLIIWRVKGHAKPSTLPTVHYQPHADINMGQGIRNAVYSSGTSTYNVAMTMYIYVSKNV
jgi:hypothetical protein